MIGSYLYPDLVEEDQEDPGAEDALQRRTPEEAVEQAGPKSDRLHLPHRLGLQTPRTGDARRHRIEHDHRWLLHAFPLLTYHLDAIQRIFEVVGGPNLEAGDIHLQICHAIPLQGRLHVKVVSSAAFPDGLPTGHKTQHRLPGTELPVHLHRSSAGVPLSNGPVHQIDPGGEPVTDRLQRGSLPANLEEPGIEGGDRSFRGHDLLPLPE